MIGVLAAAAALLLAVAGIAKVHAPAPAAAMLRTLRPRLRQRWATLAARLAGFGELVVAGAALGLGGRVPAVLLAAAYLGLLVVAALLARGPRGVPCGCFGAADGPVGAPHLVVDLAALAVAALATVAPAGPLAGLTDRSPVVLLTGLLQAAVLAYLAFVSMTALPSVRAAMRLSGGGDR